MNENATIYLAIGCEESRPVIEQMLKSLNHKVPVVTDSGMRLIHASAEKKPDLLISGIHLSDMAGIDALIECGKVDPVPSIIISNTAEYDKVRKAMEDHVMAFLTEPVAMADLKPAIFLVQKRFEQFEELRKENAELKMALETRKWVERAKGIIMKSKDVDEETAFRELRRMANDRRAKMLDVAKVIVEGAELLES
ncbi:putative transcriptional regulatory protein pdtaR [Polystyrenella longa]|uniref:Putative transcriptional regulatory protein pdtaR n=1 Tax=Polystyrenella longa TaxID=2528007 RepID=A0A518CLD8_9PLAN|nr:ANTAR domain-containing protein [Polystyrenella longa]QDU80039.1 putative transcriptional regulatory protein pdtaR [Polystyrenella longa]